MKSFPIIAGLSGLIFITGILFVVSCSSRNTGAQNTSREIQKNQNSPESAKDSVKSKTIDSLTQWYEDTSHHFVFLTWDDGPQSPGTRNCLIILFSSPGMMRLNHPEQAIAEKYSKNWVSKPAFLQWDSTFSIKNGNF